ncbi:hypothetical protein KKE78_05305 [Patescibacteria group bacterium]|nr:hypothetical protein [Patescibacteria group bacterium]
MAKKETEKKLQRLLLVLTKGTREEVKTAKKEIERLWHKDRKVFYKSAHVVFEYFSKFDQIGKVENQAAFASGLSFFFLSLGDEYFDILADFTLKVFQHPNGSVREAIRKTADWLCMSLTARAEPFIYPKGKKLTEKQKNMQKKAEYQYINFVKELELLIDKYDEETEKVRYINEMKPSVNKSLQFFWSRLTVCRVYRRILEKIKPLPYEIARKKEETEKKLKQILKEVQSDSSLEDIKDIIYNESSHDCLTEILAMFDNCQNALKLQDILETVNDAWNYFPHKILNSLSPAEKVLEYQRIQQKGQNSFN